MCNETEVPDNKKGTHSFNSTVTNKNANNARL